MSGDMPISAVDLLLVDIEAINVKIAAFIQTYKQVLDLA